MNGNVINQIINNVIVPDVTSSKVEGFYTIVNGVSKDFSVDEFKDNNVLIVYSQVVSGITVGNLTSVSALTGSSSYGFTGKIFIYKKTPNTGKATLFNKTGSAIAYTVLKMEQEAL